MSEQTPNSEGLSGAEPSMEDILASIRKIISDDEPVAMESPEDAPTVDLVETAAPVGLEDMMKGIHPNSNDLTSDAVLDAAVVQPGELADEGESVDLNIDDVLAGLDGDLLGSDIEEISLETDLVLDDVDTGSESLDTTEIIPEADDDILSFLDADIPLSGAETVDVAQVAPESAVVPTAALAELARKETVADDNVEMDSLLDEILMSPLPDEEPLIETDFADDTASTEESDLELVKSLMADLADDPDGLDAEEDLDALLAIPEAEDEVKIDEALTAIVADVEVTEAEAAKLEAVEAPEDEDDILGDILDMTIEDELQSHPDDIDISEDTELEALTSLDGVLDAEQDNIAENIDLDEGLPSLSEIAAAAEADAVAVETVQAPQAVAATAGLVAAVGGAAIGATAKDAASLEIEAEAEAEIDETYLEPIPEPISTPEETSMPVKAVKTDAILDEVTETAAAGAFAELNQVVEEKAVFSESGPRIGDLVQDALRPMLKEWLDANLKGIVERAVAKEVKRISSGK